MGISTAVTRVAAQIAGGNQDITTAALGGLTPCAVFFSITRAVANDTAADGARLGFGAATSIGHQWACAAQAEHNVTPTVTTRTAMTDESVAILLPGFAGIDGEAAFVTFIPDGVRINWGNAPAAGYLITARFFAGTDLTAEAGTFTLGNQNIEVDVNGLGFEPDALLLATHCGPFDDTIPGTSLLSHGCAINDGADTQMCWAQRSGNGVAAGALSSRITATYGIGQVDAAGAWAWGGDFGNFDANGFSCWARLGNSGDDIGYLALAFNDKVDFWAGIIDTPVGVGNQDQVGCNFEPQYVHVGTTQMPAIDTSYANGYAGSVGVGSFTDVDEYSDSHQDEDASNPTDTQSYSSNTAATLPQDSGAAGHVAAWVAMLPTGWRWNFTATLGTAVKWWTLVIEVFAEPAPPVPPPPPPTPPVPPVVIPTTPSLHQMTGLSLSVFKPTIIYGDPIIYIPDGMWIEELRNQISGWNHTSLAVGGYDKAGFTINDRQSRLERWFEEGLGNHIECYNHAQELIWEGFVNKVSVNLGPLSAVRGPLLDIANHVAVVYSELDTSTSPPVRGERTRTAYAADLHSQSLYGYVGGIISGGTATTVDAEQIRDTYLAENALPQTTQSVAGPGGPSVTIECLGYHHWLKTYVYNYTANTGTENLSAKITAVLNAEWNTIINGNMDIVTNTLAVDRYEDKDKTAWALIKALVALGDANSARYLFGVWAGRRAIYEAAPTTETAYQQHTRDPAMRVKTLTESVVMPWDVVPGKWIFFPDFLVGRTQDRQRRRDPRYMFIESVAFTAPWDVKMTGGKMDLAPQLIARLGLAGTGG